MESFIKGTPLKELYIIFFFETFPFSGTTETNLSLSFSIVKIKFETIWN